MQTPELPYTGSEYLESLKDDREVWIYGKRVKDVTTHPAFRNPARMIARLYDALHDPKMKDVLTTKTDTGSGGFTHKFFKAAKSADDLLQSRNAIAEWAKITYGWMGRSPDYKASLTSTLGANSEFYKPFDDNAKNWYKKAQEKVLFLNHAIINPPIDRSKPINESGDVCIKVEKETDAGIIVSGAKVVATGSVLTHHNFIGQYTTSPINDPNFGLIFIAPMNTPGIKLFCRPSYSMNADITGSPFDYPLSSRFDENDAIFVFDKVLIPWENVLVYRDLNKVNNFFALSGFIPGFTFHACVRFAVKLDFIAGLLLKAVELTGSASFRGVQAHVGEVMAWRNLFWSISEAMAAKPDKWIGDTVLPNTEFGLSYRVFATQAYPRVKEIIEQIVASGLIYLNSHAVDFKTPEIEKYLSRYVRGSEGSSAMERVKIMKMLWDAVGTEFGGRHELYERNYAGNHENIRMETLFYAQATGRADELKSFVNECLSEYDIDGWTSKDLINPSDVNVHLKKFSATI